MEHHTAHMRHQEGSGTQPQHPQHNSQTSQALLHSHACPIAAAARNTCTHVGAGQDCPSCHVFTHAEAAHNGWLQILCICQLHNPNPRLNTPAGRHKLEDAVKRSGARELVTLSWARGTINSLAQMIDANFERVLQARVSGAESITEDDVRVINEAGKLMARIMPYMRDTGGNFWINDRTLLIPVQQGEAPQSQERQKRPAAADHHRRQSREAWHAFEDFKRRVDVDLEFMDREQAGDQLVFYKEGPGVWAKRQAHYQPKHMQEISQETMRLAESGMSLSEQFELLLGRQRVQQQQQAHPLVANGSTSSPSTATPKAPWMPALGQQAEAQPRVVVSVPAPQWAPTPQQPNMKQPPIPVRPQRQQPQQKTVPQQGRPLVVDGSAPKPTALGRRGREQQESQPGVSMPGYHHPAPGYWTAGFPKLHQLEEQDAQQQPARPLVVNGSAAKPNVLELKTPGNINTREQLEARSRAEAQTPWFATAMLVQQQQIARLQHQARQQQARHRQELYGGLQEQHMLNSCLARANAAQSSNATTTDTTSSSNPSPIKKEYEENGMAAALNNLKANDVRMGGMDDAHQPEGEGKGKGKCEEKGKQQSTFGCLPENFEEDRTEQHQHQQSPSVCVSPPSVLYDLYASQGPVEPQQPSNSVRHGCSSTITPEPEWGLYGSPSDGTGSMLAETAGSLRLQSPPSSSENEWMEVVMEEEGTQW